MKMQKKELRNVFLKHDPTYECIKETGLKHKEVVESTWNGLAAMHSRTRWVFFFFQISLISFWRLNSRAKHTHTPPPMKTKTATQATSFKNPCLSCNLTKGLPA